MFQNCEKLWKNAADCLKMLQFPRFSEATWVPKNAFFDPKVSCRETLRARELRFVVKSSSSRVFETIMVFSVLNCILPANYIKNCLFFGTSHLFIQISKLTRQNWWNDKKRENSEFFLWKDSYLRHFRQISSSLVVREVEPFLVSRLQFLVDFNIDCEQKLRILMTSDK